MHDGRLTLDYEDSGSTCFIEQEYKRHHVGTLDSARIFINDLNADSSPFSGNLRLQGHDESDDPFDENWVDLKTVDASIR